MLKKGTFCCFKKVGGHAPLVHMASAEDVLYVVAIRAGDVPRCESSHRSAVPIELKYTLKLSLLLFKFRIVSKLIFKSLTGFEMSLDHG